LSATCFVYYLCSYKLTDVLNFLK